MVELKEVNSELLTYGVIWYGNSYEIKALINKKVSCVIKINHLRSFVQQANLSRGNLVEINSSLINYHSNFYQELTNDLSEKLEKDILASYTRILDHNIIIKEIECSINIFKKTPLDEYLNYKSVTDTSFVEALKKFKTI